MVINVLSLFDGISCGQVALERAGISVNNYYASEVDKHTIKVTMNNYPNTIQLGDVRNINLKHLPKIDLMIGGSPCQNFSFAGKRKGMSTKDNIEITSLDQYLKLKSDSFEFEGQSYLFWEYIRIKEDLNPKWFLLENVKMSKKWQSVLSSAIGVEPIAINSNLVSAQNRKRLYWTNIPNTDQPKDRGIFFKDIKQPLDGDYYWPEWRYKKFVNKEYKYRITYTVCVDNSKSRTLRKSCGCECIEEVVKVPTILQQGGSSHPKELHNTTLRNLNCLELERLQTLPDNYTDCIPKTYRYKCIGNSWTIDVIAHIFSYLKEALSDKQKA